MLRKCKKLFTPPFSRIQNTAFSREHENVSPNMENTRKHPFTLILFTIRSHLFSANNDKCKPGLTDDDFRRSKLEKTDILKNQFSILYPIVLCLEPLTRGEYLAFILYCIVFEHAYNGEAIIMLRQVIHKVHCLASERLRKIVVCKNEVFIVMRAKSRVIW